MAVSSPVAQPAQFRRSALWLALLAAPLAHAEPVTLDAIEVTAERVAEADAVVDAQALERYQADDLEDVFAG
ncbi:MAG: TonB-dependent receptor, partial [Marinobacter sp.]